MGLLKSFFGTDQSATHGSASAIDAVTYVASLASDPSSIDPLLDPLREITSRMQPGQSLSEADQTALAGICLKLEAHLIEQDPLRQFDRASLQAKVAQKFPKPNPAESIFWAKLKT